MIRIPILLILIAFAAFAASPRKIRVKHRIDAQKEAKARQASDSHLTVLSPDSIGWQEVSGRINLYGYDKTVNSSKESLFAVNGMDSCAVVGMTLDITYLDMKGRQLHRRNVDLDCGIPAGETRKIDFPTWDTQKSFYFHKSSVPKKQATPFNVKVSLKSLVLRR